MKSPTEEQTLMIRKSRCIKKYYGSHVNLLYNHGQGITPRSFPICPEKEHHVLDVFLDVKTRIGVKNEFYHVLAGTKCDLIAIYAGCCEELYDHSDSLREGYAVYVKLNDVKDFYSYSKLVTNIEHILSGEKLNRDL